MSRITAIAVLALVLLGVVSAAGASFFDLYADVNLATNPQGNWSFGWEYRPGEQFNLYDTQYVGIDGSPYWWSAGMPGNLPAIWKNLSDQTLSGVAPGEISLHPGTDEQASIARFTSPETGHARISGYFGAGDIMAMEVDVLVNNELVFYDFSNYDSPFDLTVDVSVGDTVDFVVWHGYYYGNTPLHAAVDITPSTQTSTSPPGFFNPGWNWFSLPLIPEDDNVTAIFGANNLTNRLYWWDPVGKTMTLYPDDFTTLGVQESYLAFLGTTFDITLTGVPTPPGYSVSVPEAGWTWVGFPKTGTEPLSGVMVRNVTMEQTRTAAEDAAAPDAWLNWNWVYWDSVADTARILGFSGSDDTMLHPWYGYRVWANTRNLEIVYPEP